MKHKATQRKKQRKPIDKIIFVAAIVEPMFVLPQIIQIFRFQNAESISLITWVGFSLLTMLWIWWAIVYKERVVLVYQGLYMIMNTAVIVGALIYGGKWI